MQGHEEYLKFLDLLLEGDKKGCHSFCRNFLKKPEDVKRIYLEIFKPALYEVGNLWEKNEISVAKEHIATSIVESLFPLACDFLFEVDRIGKSIIVTCVEGELHQVGARMVADFFELGGWDSIFIGADTPVDDLIENIEESSPDLVGISVSLFIEEVHLRNCLEKLNKKFPSLDILIGGMGVGKHEKMLVKEFPDLFIIKNADSLDEFIYQKKAA